MKNKSDVLRKTTLSTLSGAILVSSVPVHVFADALNIEAEQEALSQDILEDDTTENGEQSSKEVNDNIKDENEEIKEEVEDVKDEEMKNDNLSNGVDLEQEEETEEEVPIEEEKPVDVVVEQQEAREEKSDENLISTQTIDKTQVVVDIPDANLEVALREALNKPTGEITQADMERLTTLSARSKNISSIEGLQYAINLKTIDLSGNVIKDMTPLSDLLKLTSFNCFGCKVSDISPLTNLIELVNLDLRSGTFDNLKPLEKLVKLKSLQIGHNRNISDVRYLSNLTNLELLHLSEMSLTDISPLESLTKLTHLELYGNKVEDLDSLSNMVNLKALYLYNNQITDISGLSGLTNLTTLDLGDNRITDIFDLSGLTNLKDLKLYLNQITDISSLSGLTNLTTLHLHNNQITDISDLSGLTKLTTLSLNNNQITDISGLSGLTNLTNLQLYNNQITDTSDLSGLTKLTTLSLNNNQITDISNLSELINLKDLRLQSNQITDISGLSGLTKLTTLYLYNNQITDISGLSGLTNLTTLQLHNNQITDMSPLKDLEKITTLKISNQTPKLNVTLQEKRIKNTFINRDGSYMTITSLPTGVTLSDDMSEFIFESDELGRSYVIRASGTGTTINATLTVEDSSIENMNEELEAALQEFLGKAESITKKDMESLTSLSLKDKGLSDLTGLEYAIHLTELDLSGNELASIPQLKSLTKLQSLNIAENSLQDVSSIVHLTNLENLNLSDNQLQDLTGLGGLTTLKTLNLAGNSIQEVSELETLVRLEHLNLNQTDLSQLVGLEPLVKLKELSLQGNQIQHLEPIQSLIQLEKLNLKGNDVKSLEPLNHLVHLVQLNLENNQIQDLEPLTDLSVLEDLNLNDNHVSTIEALSNVTALRNLSVRNNSISSIETLSKLVNLERLDVTNNQIIDLSPLKELSQLSDLTVGTQEKTIHVNLTNNQMENPLMDETGAFMNITQLPGGVRLSEDKSTLIFDTLVIGDTYTFKGSQGDAQFTLKVVVEDNLVQFSDSTLEAAIRDVLKKPVGEINQADMETLNVLDLSGQGIADLSGLEYAIHLTELVLNETNVSNLNPLASLTQLTRLELAGTGVNSLEVVRSLKALKTLNISQTQISDLTGLSNLTGLTQLEISHNGLVDVSELSQLVKLEVLVLEDNQISNLSFLTNLTSLKVLNLSSNEITDLSAVRYLTKLTTLNLASNRLTNITPLSSLTALTTLDIQNNQVKEIDSLRGLIKLKELVLSDNRISVIEALSGLKQLTKLHIDGNEISDFSSLKELRQLVETDYSNQTVQITVPQKYTYFINPFKDAEGDYLPLTLTEGEMSDDNRIIILENPTSNLIRASVSDVDYSSELTIQLSAGLPTTIIGVEQETLASGDKRILIETSNAFYPIEKIVLSNGTEVLGDRADFLLTRSGHYVIKAYDVAGNEFETTLDITVTRPMVTINRIPVIEAKDLTIKQGDIFNPLDYVTATDHEDDNDTLKIEVIKNTVNTKQYGVYEITYKVTDSQGASSTKTIQVVVLPRLVSINEAPKIEAENITLTQGSSFNPLDYVVATDREDDDSLLKVEVIKNTVDMNYPGRYEVTYKVTDSQGASSIKTIQVAVLQRLIPLNVAPRIEAKNLSIFVGYELDLMSLVKVADKEDGELAARLVSSDFDNTKPGIYSVTYEAIDSQGAKTTKTIQITVRGNYYTRSFVLSFDEVFKVEEVVYEVAKEQGLVDIEIIENEVKENIPGEYRIVFEGTNMKEEREVHQVKVTVVDDKIGDETNDETPSFDEEVETGIQSGLIISLGSLLSLVSTPFFFTRRRKK